MNLDNQLKDALRDQAGTAEATPKKWDAVVSRAARARRARRSQRWIVAGLSAAAVIAIVAGVWITSGDRDERQGPITNEPTEDARGPNGAPPYVIVATNDGKLQIRESGSGDVVRTLEESFDPRLGRPNMATSPDGRYLYTDRPIFEPCTDGIREIVNDGTREIVRVDLVLGGSSVIAQGQHFALSPDGRRIAYLAGCGNPRHLVTRTMEGTGEQRWMSTADEQVELLRWSTDNRMLSVLLVAGESESLRLVDTTSGTGLTSLQDMQEIPVPEFVRPFGFIGADELLGLATPEDQTQVVGFNTAGDPTRTLGVIPGVADALSASGSPDGRHALVLLETPGGAVSAGEPPMRWLSIVSDGVERPHSVADDVIAATWLTQLPSNSAGPRPQGGVPETIVAASANGDIVELDGTNGGVLRTVAPRAPQPRGRNEEIALSPDGKYVYFENAVEDLDRGCEASAFETGEIMRVRRSGGPVESVVTGRWPAISPDGKSLAFITYERCDSPGRLGIIAAESGEDAQLWEAPEGISFEGPLSWDAAGDSVLVTVGRGETWASTYVDTTSTQRVVTGATDLDFSDRRPIAGTWTGSGQRASYSLIDGSYAFLVNGRDQGSIRFDGEELISFEPDGTFKNCTYIVENAKGLTQLYLRACSNTTDDPTMFGGYYTGAAW